MDNRIKIDEVLSRYGSLDEVWPENDKWHLYTHTYIHKEIQKYFATIKDSDCFCLNIGSGGYEYELKLSSVFHLDVCDRNLPIGRSVIGDAQYLPFLDASFDIIICVGSVLNYCDAAQTISEINRVLKNDGVAIIEFDKSENFEFIGLEAFCENVRKVSTFYNGSEEKIYVYSEKYVKSLLKAFNFKILSRKPFHIASSMFLPMFHHEKSVKLASLDRIFEKIPLINKYSSNVIFICEKTS